MKKTLIALLALTPCAMGDITLSDGAEFTTPSYTLNREWTEGGASVTVLLDVEKFAALFDTATSSARPVFISMSGADSNIVGIQAHEDDRITGASGVVAGGTYNNLYSFGSDNADSIASVDWSTAKAAALTMALETSSQGTRWTLSVLKADGTYTDLTAGLTNLRWSSMQDITKIDIDTNVITQAYAFDGFISGDTAYSLNKQAIAAPIPEPTTATLSLLALAGLAARRRRK